MIFRYVLFLSIGAAVLFCAGGCGGSSSSSPVIIDDGGPREWTIMVYMNADNDLERFSIDNVQQMQNVGSTSRVKIVVQWDRHPGYSTSDGNWTGTRRYEILRGSKMLVQDIGEVNMGSPQSVINFITWAQQNYPANRYCLIIWNHGSGWRSVKPDALTRGISYDETSNAQLNTLDLPDILSAAPSRIDLVAMDACMMQMLEVAYEIRNTAGYLVGSPDPQAGQGYVYDKWLWALVGNPTMDAPSLGTVIAQKYIDSYRGYTEITQSVLDLSRIDNVGRAVDNLASALLPLVTSQATAIRNARQSALEYSSEYSYVDLLDYASRINNTITYSQVRTAYTSLASAVNSAVVYSGYGGSDRANSHGLSIWAPSPNEFRQISTRYRSLQISQDTDWDNFLAAQVQ